jgi:F0F1-type ATP synthase membrane subunit a
MGRWGLLPLETDAPPEFGVGAFDSRPLFPSEAWLKGEEGACALSLADVTDNLQLCQLPWTDYWFTNHIAQAAVGALLVIGFWLFVMPRKSASGDPRRNGVVPGKRQFLGEYFYNIIRNGVARDIIGHDYQKYVPYLVALCSFIIVNNLFGETFLFMFPTFSKIGFAWGLAICSWLLYNAVGIKKKGLFGYLKAAT